MFIEIMIFISVIVFAVLAYFVIQTLITVQKTLKKLDFFMDGMELRMEKMDPFIRSISNVGDICEEKTHLLQKEFMEKKKVIAFQEEPTGDLTDWLLLGLILIKKVLKRR
ncbi:putative uncharacterized protein [Parachlamydia acanthamoebae UV-7]|jgi:uncharacterized protein YoxC|uniref:Uncharacterized protein n=2 Tax=Parachlamydia acanthamoebae TaxID=83552 RepID=F8KUY4_PARAV|nr:hypothetical protein [Parachlamydia acanthamoebae]CCB85049.1 putative uncharacterized protein [Parachlamydia acanthamoebae UV-7]